MGARTLSCRDNVRPVTSNTRDFAVFVRFFFKQVSLSFVLFRIGIDVDLVYFERFQGAI